MSERMRNNLYGSAEKASLSSRTSALTLIAALVASAAALQIIESPLPRIVPWLKPGLANALTLYALLRISSAAGVTVAIFRTFVAAIFMGTLLSPVHLISLAGALSAALVMAVTRKMLPDRGVGVVSVLGAIASNSAQLLVVQIMFASNLSFWFHMALMIWIAIPSGLVVAKITQELIRRTT